MKAIIGTFILLSVLGTNTIKAENFGQGGYPSYNYESSILTRVDIPSQLGKYQNVVFKYNSQINAWILQEINTVDNIPQTPEITQVLPLFSTSIDVPNATFKTIQQLVLTVLGKYKCGRIGQINQRRIDRLFEIQITQVPLLTGEICDEKIRNFLRSIKLDTYRLDEGRYEYNINNGDYIGYFILQRPGVSYFKDCGGEQTDESCTGIIFF
jgi:hypothetical protein